MKKPLSVLLLPLVPLLAPLTVHAAFNPCNNLAGDAQGKCDSCFQDGKGFWTALGCLQTDTSALIPDLIRILMGLAGFLLFIQIIIGASEIIFGGGEPAKVANAQKRITNSIIAILFIIFGVTILQVIGVQILHLPGFFDR
jgi:hypothetical protein